MTTKPLTHKQKRFVEKYIETGNGTRSVMAVYDTADQNVASVMAIKNLQRPAIRMALREALVTWDGDSKVRKQRIVDKLAEIAFMDDDAKTTDQIKALELLGKFEGMWIERAEITHVFPQVYTPDKLPINYESTPIDQS